MPENKHCFMLRVRLTDEEHDVLKEQSERTGRSMSDLIRAAWKKMRIVELPPADFQETVVQLRRIGNDLGQLTRAANAREIRFQPHSEVDFRKIKTGANDFTTMAFDDFQRFFLVGTGFFGGKYRPPKRPCVRYGPMHRKTQNPVSARTCGFDPRHRHHLKVPKALILLGFRDFLCSFPKMVPVCLKG